MRLKFPNQNQKRSDAFTLIELMVVCLLVAILTAMIVPEMRGSYQDALLRATSRKLLDAFDLAYSQAVSLDQTERVRLDTQTGRYEIEKRVQKNGQDDFEPLKDVSGGEGELDGHISIEVRNTDEDLSDETNQPATTDTATDSTGEEQPNSEPDDVISFYPDGTADNREVVLRDSEGFGLALRVNPITARVHIVELKRQFPNRASQL